MLYRGQKLALAEFLPLDAENWITCGNALRLDWLSICPPTGTGVKHRADDLFRTPLDQAQIDFENEGGETYICGNPPYAGSTWQNKEQKAELQEIFGHRTTSWKLLDYVAAWFIKAASYGTQTNAATAFVSTKSICQGQQVPILWPLVFKTGHEIVFAHTSFKWDNLASHKAGVTVVIVGFSKLLSKIRRLYVTESDEKIAVKNVDFINAYLVSGHDVIIEKASRALSELAQMDFGSKPVDGGNLLLNEDDVNALGLSDAQRKRFIYPIYGSAEFIHGLSRYCIWITPETLDEAQAITALRERITAVRSMRLASSKAATIDVANMSFRFGEVRQKGTESIIANPAITSENRNFLPCGLLSSGTIITNKCYALYDAPLWNMALIASRLHWMWIGTVCARMRTDFSYSNTLGWNTFPVPTLTHKNKADLTRCAEDILLTREAHFPATIADLYDPDAMPADLHAAHERNDEVLERIYIGRRFRNDTERLEKLFEFYTKMTSDAAAKPVKARKARG